MATSSTEPTPVADTCADDALKIRICWKGPKGNRMCITVAKGIKAIKDDLFVDAFMASDGSSMLLDMSATDARSFTIAESVNIETCGSSFGLKAGTEIDVRNGYAILE